MPRVLHPCAPTSHGFTLICEFRVCAHRAKKSDWEGEANVIKLSGRVTVDEVLHAVALAIDGGTAP
ncbi:hypothetical protein L6Q96_09545 [Candidatus Binatia bacterium]|nr:hypothetical protein [Candidatus Binatia bacterium]